MSASEEPSERPGREAKANEARPPAGNVPNEKHPVPLFLRDGTDGRKGDAQDEKDEVGE